MRKKWKFLIWGLFMADLAGATQTDSLQALLSQNISSKQRVETLVSLARIQIQSKPLEAIELGHQALELALELNNPLTTAEVHNLLGIAHLQNGETQDAVSSFFEERSILETWSLNRLEAAQLLDWQRRMIRNLSLLVETYSRRGDYGSALRFSLEAVELQKKYGDERQYLNGLSRTGYFLYLTGDYERALEYKLESLKIAEALSDTAFQMAETSHLGFIHRDMNNIEKAKSYFSQSTAFAESLGDTNLIISSLNEIGNLAVIQEDYSEALKIKTQALRMAEKFGSPANISFVAHDIGIVYLQQNNPRKALQYFMRSYEIDREQGNPRNATIVLTNIGRAHAELGDLQMSLYYQKLAHEISKSSDLHALRASILADLSSTYASMGRYREAYSTLDHAYALKDSLRSEEKTRISAELEAKYESEKREKQIALLKKENDIKRLQITRQRAILFSLAGAGLMLTALAVVLINRYRIKTEANRIIEEQNRKLQESLDNVRTLKSLLPICASCKKIRDDQGYWEQVEVYIQKHAGTEFSHGICPDCIHKYYSDTETKNSNNAEESA